MVGTCTRCGGRMIVSKGADNETPHCASCGSLQGVVGRVDLPLKPLPDLLTTAKLRA